MNQDMSMLIDTGLSQSQRNQLENQARRTEQKIQKFHDEALEEADQLVNALIDFKKKSIKLDQLMQGMVIFETIFEEQLNQESGPQAMAISKQNTFESIKRVIHEQFFQYGCLMRLIDSVIPSASVLEECILRDVVECGGQLDLMLEPLQSHEEFRKSKEFMTYRKNMIQKPEEYRYQQQLVNKYYKQSMESLNKSVSGRTMSDVSYMNSITVLRSMHGSFKGSMSQINDIDNYGYNNVDLDSELEGSIIAEEEKQGGYKNIKQLQRLPAAAHNTMRSTMFNSHMQNALTSYTPVDIHDKRKTLRQKMEKKINKRTTRQVQLNDYQKDKQVQNKQAIMPAKAKEEVKIVERRNEDMIDLINKIPDAPKPLIVPQNAQESSTTMRSSMTSQTTIVGDQGEHETKKQKDYDEFDSELDDDHFDEDGNLMNPEERANAAARMRRAALKELNKEKEEKDNAILRLFPGVPQMDKVTFKGDLNNRYDEYGKICEMFQEYPGYSLRLIRRVVREKQKGDEYWELHQEMIKERTEEANKKIAEAEKLIKENQLDWLTTQEREEQEQRDREQQLGIVKKIGKKDIEEAQRVKMAEEEMAKAREDALKKQDNIKKGKKDLFRQQRELMHIRWLDQESIMLKNFDSVIVNMSRFLFEAPHLEEVNYFSTTYHNKEKVFLLVLSMFIINIDLSTDPDTKVVIENQELYEKEQEFTSIAYKCTKEEILDTFKLMFEGQSRKFTAVNFLVQLTQNAPESEFGKQQLPSVNTLLSKLQKDFHLVDGTEKEPPQDSRANVNKLILLDNKLQFVGRQFDKKKDKEGHRKEKIRLPLVKDLWAKNEDKSINLTEISLQVVDSLFEQMCIKKERMPVTIRIMLKLRVGMQRYLDEDDQEERSKMFTEMPYIEVAQNEYDEDDKLEARALAELLIGVWLNLLFRHPSMMLSGNGKEVNYAILWSSKLIFEHLLSLEYVSQKYSFVPKDNTDLDPTIEQEMKDTFDIDKINTWLKARYSKVVRFYNDLINIETDDLWDGVLNQQELIGGLHLKLAGINQISENKKKQATERKNARTTEIKEIQKWNRQNPNEKKEVPEKIKNDEVLEEINNEREKAKEKIMNDLKAKQQKKTKQKDFKTKAERIEAEVQEIFEMDPSKQLQLEMVHKLSIIGVTDFYTICYIATKEYGNQVVDSYAVAQIEGGTLRVAVGYFAEKDKEIRLWLEENRYKNEKELRILADLEQREGKVEQTRLYKQEKDKFKALLIEYQRAVQEDLGKLDKEVEENSYGGIQKEQLKRPVFKMKKKKIDKDEQRPYMSNSTFILGMNKITHFSMLTDDISRKQKKARVKVTEKWIEMYEAYMPKNRAKFTKEQRKDIQETITRVYYYLKQYLRTFDLEKLLHRERFKEHSTSKLDTITDLGFLLKELVSFYQSSDGAQEQGNMLTILTQLQYDLKTLDLLYYNSGDTVTYGFEMKEYVKLQKILIEQFSMFLTNEIKFAEKLQLNLQAFAKNIQSQMHDMQNSVLNLRNFFNKKAPFMIRDFDLSEQTEYNLDKQTRVQNAKEFLFSTIKDHEQIVLQLRIKEYFLEDFLVVIFQEILCDTPIEFEKTVESSWCQFDLDVRKIPLLFWDPQKAKAKRKKLKQIEAKRLGPQIGVDNIDEDSLEEEEDKESVIDTNLRTETREDQSLISAVNEEGMRIITKKELRDELLTKNCKNWGNERIYETQIGKLREAFGPNRNKTHCGIELEKTIRQVVESTLVLMEMNEVQYKYGLKDEQAKKIEEITPEEKAFLCTAYMFGSVILEADLIEKEEKRKGTTEKQGYWMSEMKVVRQLIAAVSYNFDQYGNFYSKMAIRALAILKEEYILPKSEIVW